jgi:hypothetical protein
VSETTIKILAAKLQMPAECFATNRDFLRGVARLARIIHERHSVAAKAVKFQACTVHPMRRSGLCNRIGERRPGSMS